jgi:hypothetical protein
MTDLEDRLLLAMAIAKQGRHAEAAAMVEPHLKRQRALAETAKDMPYQRVHLAMALTAAAMANPSSAPALLAEARAALDRLPPGIAKRRSVAELRKIMGSG